MHSDGCHRFSTTTSTLFRLLFTSHLPHPPVTEEVSSGRARTHQGSLGRTWAQGTAAWRGRQAQRCCPGTRRARSHRRAPAQRSVSLPACASGAESAGAQLRETPVPPPGRTARGRRVLGASPLAPGAGSARGDRWENYWRMRGASARKFYYPSFVCPGRIANKCGESPRLANLGNPGARDLGRSGESLIFALWVALRTWKISAEKCNLIGAESPPWAVSPALLARSSALVSGEAGVLMPGDNERETQPLPGRVLDIVVIC